MISSPSFSVRATACASRKLSVVMFAPNAISSGREPVKSAPACARPVVQRVGLRAGHERAAEVRVRAAQVGGRWRRSRRRGVCEPPGPSRNAAGRPLTLRERAGKRRRSAATSSGGVVVAVTRRERTRSYASAPMSSADSRPEPRPGARPRDRGGRACRQPLGRPRRQERRRRRRRRRDARDDGRRLDGRRRRDRRGREGRGADAVQRRADRRRLAARRRHRGRPAGGHDADREGPAERALRRGAVGARDDVRPGPVRLHGEDGGRRRHRRPAVADRPDRGRARPRRRAPPRAASAT